jgi:hypothetical protein
MGVSSVFKAIPFGTLVKATPLSSVPPKSVFSPIQPTAIPKSLDAPNVIPSAPPKPTSTLQTKLAIGGAGLVAGGSMLIPTILNSSAVNSAISGGMGIASAKVVADKVSEVVDTLTENPVNFAILIAGLGGLGYFLLRR